MRIYEGILPESQMILEKTFPTCWGFARTHVQNSTVQSTGWRRCIGCLELRVSFRNRATSYRALLLKPTSKDEASYGSAAPCISLYNFPKSDGFLSFQNFSRTFQNLISPNDNLTVQIDSLFDSFSSAPYSTEDSQ